MKKLFAFLFTSILLSTGAMAQSKDVKQDEKDLKNSITNKKLVKHRAGRNLAHLRIEKAVHDRRQVRHRRWSIRHQGRHLENHGVIHPIHKAKVQAKIEKDKKNQ